MATLLCTAVAAQGCGGSIDDKEDDACPPDVVGMVERFLCAVDALKRGSNQVAADAGQACVSLAADLGTIPPPLDDPPTGAQVTEACAVAAGAITAEVEDAGCPTIGSTSGQCLPDPNALSACQGACSGNEACVQCCALVAPSELICTPPAVTATSSDATFQATLEQHLPQLLLVAAQASSLNQAVQVGEFVQVLEAAHERPGCATRYAELLMSAFEEAAEASVAVNRAMSAAMDVLLTADCTESSP